MVQRFVGCGCSVLRMRVSVSGICGAVGSGFYLGHVFKGMCGIFKGLRSLACLNDHFIYSCGWVTYGPAASSKNTKISHWGVAPDLGSRGTLRRPCECPSLLCWINPMRGTAARACTGVLHAHSSWSTFYACLLNRAAGWSFGGHGCGNE
jgi:hypothetical protein